MIRVDPPRRASFATLAATMLLGTMSGARAEVQDVAAVASPDGRLVVTLGVNGEGRASWRLEREGRALVGDSRLGFLFTDSPKIERNLAGREVARRKIDETWEQPWGERRFVRNHASELRVRFTEQSPPSRSFEVLLRVFDDGVGFRYEFPKEWAPRQVNIAEELTEFDIVPPSTAWWIPAGEWNRYEYLYQRTPLAEVSQVHTPLTLRTGDGVHLSIHEASLVDYSSMWLRRVEAQRLRATLSPSSQGAKVSRVAPFATPWRVLLVADSAAALYAASDLILNLNEPNALGDVSWAKPMKYAGVWWGMHLGTETWASGGKHGATTANTKRYIDFAARSGLGGVLVEGWNIGWDADWFANGESFSFTEPYPDFDLPALAAYAKEKGVALIGHHETSANIAHYEGQLSAAFDLDQKYGIPAVKTGYVADAGGVKARGEDGQIRYEWHDGQVMSRHHLHVVTEAAKRHISIDAHEPIKDTGLRRTYPNWMTREGARGMEYAAWGNPQNPPGHEATLVFTRMLAGPFDYTPGIVSLIGKDDRPIESTLAKQLANYVVIYSPLQMVADLPEHYEQQPKAFEFIRAVPVDWAETKVLKGEVGEFAAIARKDRGSEDWYLGAVTDSRARSLDIPLDFLEAGREYRAHIYRDGEDAHYQTNRFAFEVERRELRRGDTLALRLAPGGGAAVRFEAR